MIKMTTKDTYKFLAVLAALAAMFMSACTSEPPQKEQPKPPEFLTGRSAFQKCYIQARGWQADAQPIRLASQVTSDSDGHEGKAAVWTATFGSASLARMKTFAWSGTNAADAPDRGVTQGGQDSYSPGNSSTHAFNVGFTKFDSDAAFDVAQKHGGDKILQQDPKTPVFYLLDWSTATNKLIWHVVYGAQRSSAKLAISVDATTGEFIRVEK